MEPSEARRSTGRILLGVAIGAAVLLVLALTVDLRGKGSSAGGLGLPDPSNLVVGGLALVVMIAAGIGAFVLRRG